MDFEHFGEPASLTKAKLGALNDSMEAAVADLLLLEFWEVHKPMHLGLLLRVRQIRRANPGLAADIAAELAARRKEVGRRGSKAYAASALAR